MQVLEHIQRYFFSIPEIIGIQAELLDGGISWSWGDFEKKKHTINLTESETQSSTPPSGHNFDQKPVCLVLTGRGILHKSVSLEKRETSEVENLIHELFPNIDLKDIYYQEFSNKNRCFISVVRKNIVDELVALFSQFNLMHIHLGAYCLNELAVLANSEELQLGHQHLMFANNEIESYSYKKNQEGKDCLPNIKEKLELAYGAVVNLISERELAGINHDKFLNGIDEAKHQTLSKRLTVIVPVLILFSLLINFFVFQQLFSDNQLISNKANQVFRLEQKNKDLKSELQLKNAFLSEQNWFNTYSFTQISDEIGYSVPKSILLEGFSINPVNPKESKKKKVTVLDQGTVSVTGTCQKATELKPWIEKIEQLAWCSSVEIADYHFDSKKKQGQFELKIKVK